MVLEALCRLTYSAKLLFNFILINILSQLNVHSSRGMPQENPPWKTNRKCGMFSYAVLRNQHLALSWRKSIERTSWSRSSPLQWQITGLPEKRLKSIPSTWRKYPYSPNIALSWRDEVEHMQLLNSIRWINTWNYLTVFYDLWWLIWILKWPQPWRKILHNYCRTQECWNDSMLLREAAPLQYAFHKQWTNIDCKYLFTTWGINTFFSLRLSWKMIAIPSIVRIIFNFPYHKEDFSLLPIKIKPVKLGISPHISVNFIP